MWSALRFRRPVLTVHRNSFKPLEYKNTTHSRTSSKISTKVGFDAVKQKSPTKMAGRLSFHFSKNPKKCKV
jgi:hypothetical protein